MSELVERAELAAQRAYAPYSNYLVGAVVRTTDGTEFVGTNVENAAYPLSQCAEKTAIAAAASAGYRPGDIKVVAITISTVSTSATMVISAGAWRSRSSRCAERSATLPAKTK